MAKKTVMDVDVKGKRVLVRVDYNVPLNDAGEVADDKRITASLPTVNYLLEHGARVILCSHLGRPKGEPKPEFSLKPVAVRLAQLLPNVKIGFAEDCIGPEAKRKAMALNNGEILLLENLRFHKEEEKNDSAFAKELASLAELYVSDAFGTVHRAHASTAGVAAYLPAVAGFLIGKELSIMGDALESRNARSLRFSAVQRWRIKSASSRICCRSAIRLSSAGAWRTRFSRQWDMKSAILCSMRTASGLQAS